MTESELRRFNILLDRIELINVLNGSPTVNEESLEHNADLSLVSSVMAEQGSRRVGRRGSSAAWDAELVEPLHRSLMHLPVSHLVDMRFWHWLCACQFRQFVLERWCPDFGGDLDQLRPSQLNRFLGSPTLEGVSRNALARIYWCGAVLGDGGNYELARLALQKQDRFQAIFERKLGLYPPAARACIVKLGDKDQATVRRAIKLLNYCLSTTVVEAMPEAQVAELIEELLDDVA